jgi:drug/metabolite transporter (DMT)-like permease
MIELWVIYALIAAAFTSLAQLTEKKVLIKEHAMEFSTVLAIAVLILSIPLFFLIDYSKLQLLPIILIFFIAIPAAIAFFLIARSIRHMKISDSIPLFSIGPGITALLAFIFLGEALTRTQTLGIMLLIFGAYVLETKKEFNLLDPFKTFKKSKYIHFILIALILYSITGIFDRIILFRLDMQPIAFVAFANLFLALNLIIMLYFFHDGLKGIKHGFNSAGKWIFLMAIFVIGYRLAQSEAVKIANIGLVVTTKRISLLFTILIGRELFHEGKRLRKIIASVIMVAGAILITLF